MSRRARDQAVLDLVASERLVRLMGAISLAYGVFEEPASTEAWLPPLPCYIKPAHCNHCRTATGAGHVQRLLQALEQGAPV